MRIGDTENFLLIECPSKEGIAFLKLEAGVFHNDQQFAATAWTCGSWDSGKRQNFGEFQDLKKAAFELPLAAGGWLRLDRDHRGWVAVSYRITGPRAPAKTAMEGEIWIEGEFAGEFCGELRALLDAAS